MGGHRNLTASIMRYLKNKEHYAILIDGPWGSGKTYYIEHELKQVVSYVGFRVCRATLYGVGSVDELAARILQAYVSLEDAGSSAGATGVTSSLLGLLGDFFKKTTGLNLSVSASMIVPMLSWKNRVLVLDDLERRREEHDKELMGYVTELVERIGCKVIFVSNYDVCGIEDRSLEKLIWERHSFRPNMQAMIEALLGEHLEGIVGTPKLVNQLVNETNRRGCNNVRALIRLRPIIEMIVESGYCQDEGVPKEVRLITVRDAVSLGLAYAEDVFGEKSRKVSSAEAYRRKVLTFVRRYFLYGIVASDQEIADQLRSYGNEFVAGSAERKEAQKGIDMVLGDDAFEDEEGLMAAVQIVRAMLQEDLGMEQIPMAMRAVGRLRSYGLLDDEDVMECDRLAERMVLEHRDLARESMLKDGSLWARSPSIDEDSWDYPSRGLMLCDKVLRGDLGINGVVDRGLEEGNRSVLKDVADWIVKSTEIYGAPVRLDQLDIDRAARAVLASDARSLRQMSKAISSISHRVPSFGATTWAEENRSWVRDLSRALDEASIESPMCRREMERLLKALNEFE